MIGPPPRSPLFPSPTLSRSSVSIGLFHGDEVVPPRLHHRARRDPDEPEQPLAVVGAPPRHDQRPRDDLPRLVQDRKSTRLNSSHLVMSYAVFCLTTQKKKI